MTISVLLVDDHNMFGEKTLAVALGSMQGLEVIGVARTTTKRSHWQATPSPTSRSSTSTCPTSAVSSWPAGYTKSVQTPRGGAHRLARLAALLHGDGGRHMGYLTKQSALDDVTEAITAAHAGRVVVPASVMERLLSARASVGPRLGPHARRANSKCCELMGRGYDAKQVAIALGISWHTGRSYTKNILVKLDAHPRAPSGEPRARLGILQHDNCARDAPMSRVLVVEERRAARQIVDANACSCRPPERVGLDRRRSARRGGHAGARRRRARSASQRRRRHALVDELRALLPDARVVGLSGEFPSPDVRAQPYCCSNRSRSAPSWPRSTRKNPRICG